MLTSQSASSKGGGLVSPALEWVNPGVPVVFSSTQEPILLSEQPPQGPKWAVCQGQVG